METEDYARSVLHVEMENEFFFIKQYYQVEILLCFAIIWACSISLLAVGFADLPPNVIAEGYHQMNMVLKYKLEGSKS